MNPDQRNIADRVLKCAISSLVFFADALRELLARMARRTPRGKCVVVYFHSVPSEQQEQFARQMDCLLRCATVVPLDQAINLRPGARSVVVTFDDAFENFVSSALPELKKRRIPATVFVITEALNKAFGPPDSFEKVMSVDQLKALPRDLVTIGSHTETHPMLPHVPNEDGRREIVGSKAKLEALLGRPILHFSFPFGGFNDALIHQCREAGYQRVFTTLPYFAFVQPDEFVVGRVRVDPTDWALEFRLKSEGAYRWLPFAFKLKEKVRAWLTELTSADSAQVASRRAALRSAIRELDAR